MPTINNLFTSTTDYDTVLKACKEAISQSGGGANKMR